MDGKRSAGGQRVRATVWLAIALVGLAATPAGGAAEPDRQTIRGTIRVAPALAEHFAPGDRLIIRLFHPKGGVDMDTTFRIVEDAVLPYAFQVAPDIDMSGSTKFNAYVLEVFTDKDRDVLGVAPGELVARTPEPVPLGTTDLVLELDRLRN